MKKLLSLIGAFGLTATTAATVVSCANKYDKKTDNGDSILMDGVNIISEDGKSQITSSDVLWRLINESGPENRSQFAGKLLNLLNASILINSEKNFKASSKTGESKVQLNSENQYYNYEFVNTIVDSFDELNNKVDAEIKREKESDTYSGKKGTKKWKQMLQDKYPGYYKDKYKGDVTLLEKKYKQDKLLSGSSNVTTTLLDTLLNTNQLGFTWIEPNRTISNINYIISLKANDAELDSYIKNNPKIIAQVYNSLHEKKEDWIKGDDVVSAENVINKKIKDWLKGSELTPDASKVKEVPDDYSNLSTFSAENRRGMLSNSQRFFMDKYYNTKAPLAISEAVIPFSTNQKMDDGINLKDFSGDDNIDVRKWDEFLTYMFKTGNDKDTPSNRWKIEQAQTSHNSNWGNVTFKQYANLLTLDNSGDFSQTLRSSVYSLVMGKPVNSIDLSNGLSKADFGKIDRNSKDGKSSLFAKVGDEGFIVFVETDGLHIVKIDGYEYLKDRTTQKPKLVTSIESSVDSLELFNKFSKKTDSEKVYELQAVESNNEFREGLNNSVSSKYLQFLINNSLLKGKTGSATSFDIFEEYKKWATGTLTTSGDDYTWATAILDYFKEIWGKKDGTDAEFVKLFLTFGEDEKDGQANNIAKSLESWFLETIKSIKSTVVNNPINNFVRKHKDWTATIKKQTSPDYPKDTMEAFDNAEIITMLDTFKDEYKEDGRSKTTKPIINNSKNVVKSVEEIKEYVYSMEYPYFASWIFNLGGTK